MRWVSLILIIGVFVFVLYDTGLEILPSEWSSVIDGDVDIQTDSLWQFIVDGYGRFSDLPWYVFALLFAVFLFVLAGGLTNFRDVIAGLSSFVMMVLVIGITILIVFPLINSFNW